METVLSAALKARFKTPREALRALFLGASDEEIEAMTGRLNYDEITSRNRRLARDDAEIEFGKTGPNSFGPVPAAQSIEQDEGSQDLEELVEQLEEALSEAGPEARDKVMRVLHDARRRAEDRKRRRGGRDWRFEEDRRFDDRPGLKHFDVDAADARRYREFDRARDRHLRDRARDIRREGEDRIARMSGGAHDSMPPRSWEERFPEAARVGRSW